MIIAAWPTCSVVVSVRLPPHTGVVVVPVRVVFASHVWFYQTDVLDDLEKQRRKQKQQCCSHVEHGITRCDESRYDKGDCFLHIEQAIYRYSYAACSTATTSERVGNIIYGIKRCLFRFIER